MANESSLQEFILFVFSIYFTGNQFFLLFIGFRKGQTEKFGTNQSGALENFNRNYHESGIFLATYLQP